MNVLLTRSQALDRATATLAVLGSRRLSQRHRGLFGRRRWWKIRRDYEALWPFADAWSALCTLASLPRQQTALTLLHDMPRRLSSYGRQPDLREASGPAGFESVVTPPLGNGGDRYYDDNAWLGLALGRHHELTEEPELLLLARRVFSFVASGWTDEETWANPGGIRWKEPKSNRSRNTCVNGPASELATRLFEKTGESTYLEWATRIYLWTRGALSDSVGLYDDQVAPDGSRTKTIWSYNQGSMIGAGALLHKHTGDPTYLDHAKETASSYIEQRGTPELMNQDPAFNAVFFRNLLLLDPERSDDRFHSMAAEYGSFMWDHMRRRDGLFVGNGSRLNNAAAMMQIYALLAGAEPHA